MRLTTASTSATKSTALSRRCGIGSGIGRDGVPARKVRVKQPSTATLELISPSARIIPNMSDLRLEVGGEYEPKISPAELSTLGALRHTLKGVKLECEVAQ